MLARGTISAEAHSRMARTRTLFICFSFPTASARPALQESYSKSWARDESWGPTAKRRERAGDPGRYPLPRPFVHFQWGDQAVQPGHDTILGSHLLSSVSLMTPRRIAWHLAPPVAYLRPLPFRGGPGENGAEWSELRPDVASNHNASKPTRP